MKKFKMNTMKKRIISIALSLVMVVSMLPLSLLNVSAATSADTGNNFYDSIINSNGTPDGYDPNDTSNPYGIAVGDTVRLSTQNELFLFRSYDKNKDDGVRETYLMENFKVNVGSDGMSGNLNLNRTLDSNGALTGGGLGEFGKSMKVKENVGYTYSFMEAVAFDPHNTGRKDHIAYVGYDETSEMLEVGATKADGTFVASIRIDVCDFLKDNKYAYQFRAANYLAITAGDYNGDGKDTIIVYFQGNDANVQLREFRLDGTSSPSAKLTRTANSADQSFFNPDYFRVDFSKFDDDISNKLAGDLATGDFNKDGIDDLAVLTYMLDPEDSDVRKLFDCNVFTPRLAINYGATSGKDILYKSASAKHIFDEKLSVGDDKHDELHTMAAAGIDAGDVDGDGYDELVIGGISAKVNSQANNSRYSDGDGLRIYPNNSRIAIYDAHNGLGRQYMDQIDNNTWQKNHIYSGDHFWQHMEIATVAINGQNAAEHIFYSGMLISYNANRSKKFNIDYKPSYFDSDPGEGETFIQSVAVGNFDENGAGREQVFFTLGYREIEALPRDYLDDDYTYKSGMIGATYNDTYSGGTVTKYGSVKQFYSNNIAKQNAPISNKGDDLDERVNFFMVAVDADTNDGVTAKYKGKGYTYTDPEVQAVLQAAPYFGELGGWGDFQGSTTYGFTTTYEFSTSEGKETSWGVGVSMEVEAVAVKVALEAQYLSAKNTEFENSLETSYSTEFSAGPKDSVILSRTPLITYVYEATVNGKPAEISMSVPLGPVYYSLSIEEYNEFVDAYNAYIDELYAGYGDHSADAKMRMENTKLKKITDAHLQSEGNPWNYQWEGDAFKVLSKNTLAYSYDGSSITSAFDETKSETITETNSEGYSIGVAVMAGFNMGGAGVVAGASGGVEENWSTCRSETTANTTSTAGTVAGMDVMQLSEDLGVPTSTLREYGFNWVFGTWDINTMGSKGKTPVFGYSLTNIKAPSEAVSDLEGVWLSDTEATLTWTKPATATGRANADCYYVYQLIDGEFQKIAEQNTSNNGVYTVKLTGLDATQNNTYVVAGYDTETKTIGVFSNAANLGPGDGEVEIRYNSETETIEWRYTNETDWTKVVTREELLYGQEITIGDNGNWFIGGVDTGVKAEGPQGREIEMQTADGKVQWRYVGETQWNDLYTVETVTGQDEPFDKNDCDIELKLEDGKIYWKFASGGQWYNSNQATPEKMVATDEELCVFIGGPWQTKMGNQVDTNLEIPSGRYGVDFMAEVNDDVDQIKVYWDETNNKVGYTCGYAIAWLADRAYMKAAGWNGTTELEFQYLKDTDMVQWRMAGETAWRDLGTVEELQDGYPAPTISGNNTWYSEPMNHDTGIEVRGAQGRSVKFQVTDAGMIQWQFEGMTIWYDWITVDQLLNLDTQTPYIGANGNWYIGNMDTGVAAQGAHGREIELRVSGGMIQWRYEGQSVWTDLISVEDEKVGGPNGPAPTVINNYWYIGETNTGIAGKAIGGSETVEIKVEDGWLQWRTGGEGEWTKLLDTSTLTKGADGLTPFIGTNGNWWIGTQDTGVKAAGTDGKDGATPEIGTNGNWWIGGVDTGVKAAGEDGKDGRGVVSIEKTKTEGLVDTYTITYTDNTVAYFTVTNGAQGAQGEQGIQGIQGEKGEDGHTPVITIQNGYWYIDGQTTGVLAEGIKGDTGNGISDISKTGTEGLVDTYTITYTNGDTATFTVTNGAQGEQGIQGEKGEDGHTPVITIDNDGNWCVDGISTGIKAQGVKGDKGDKGDDGIDGREVEFNVSETHIQWRYVGETEWNNLVSFADLKGADGQNGANGTDGKDGADGKDGVDGKDGADGEDGNTPFIGENGNWWIGETDTGVKADMKGDGTEDVDGDGIVSAKMNENGELVLTLADGSTFHAVSADAVNTGNGDLKTIKMIAIIALILSVVSLLWNTAALVISITKKKRI